MSSPNLTRGRVSHPGACYVITTVVNGRQPRFADGKLACLVAHELRSDACNDIAASLAWVVMPDHMHWLFQLRHGSLSRCVQRVKSRSAQVVNLTCGTAGALWQPGFYDHCLRGDEDLRAQARYVVANPLRSGLVHRIEEYPHWWCRWISGSRDL